MNIKIPLTKIAIEKNIIIDIDGGVNLYNNFMEDAISQKYMDLLIDEVPWKQEKIKIYDKVIPIPRLTAWYGDEKANYSYSGIKLTTIPWSETILEIKKRVEEIVHISFNSVLLNYYRDGKDSVAWHSDSEKELGQDPIIASFSLGGERVFQMKEKNGNQKYNIPLKNGSLLLMGSHIQKNWLHQIPKTTKTVSPRINMTFRNIN